MFAVGVDWPSLAIIVERAVLKSASSAAQSVELMVVLDTAGFQVEAGAEYVPSPFSGMLLFLGVSRR
jgi:hypothetical protein